MDMSPSRIPWKIIILGVTACLAFSLLLIVLPAIYGSIKAGAAAVSLRSHLQSAVDQATARDYQAADQSLAAAVADSADIHDGLLSMGNWREAPWIGTRIKALEQVERSGSAALSGMREVLDVAAEIQSAIDVAGSVGGVSVSPERSYQDLTKDEKRALVEQLGNALPRLRVAREKISIAAEAWANVPQDELFAPIRNAISPIAARLPELDQAMGQALGLLEWMVPLAGFPEPKTYLVILQNADEIRPTGGFIGNIGLVTIDSGDIQKIDFEDVYALDGTVNDAWKDQPPAILKRELGIPAWFLRDSNWSPDFPESATRLIDVYQRESKLGRRLDIHLDGVIALSPEFFRQLLLLTGPIQVENQVFNADNFFDSLQYDTEMAFHQNGLPTSQRKEIVQKVGDMLISTLMSQPSSRWPAILNVATKSLDQGDLLPYVKDPAVEAVLDRNGWSGRTLGSNEDYLWVVDANLAALKTDGVMDKHVYYSVDFTDPQGAIATVRLHYTNTNRTFTWRYTRYRSYERVYVPEGSELLSWSGFNGSPDVTRELGKQVYGAFWVIEPGKSADMTFRYRLPPRLIDKLGTGSYRLTAQKQPGAERTLTLDLRFGKNVGKATPGEDSTEFGDDRYRYESSWIKSQNFDISF